MDTDDVIANVDMKWYQIWWHVWTHPSVEAFHTILRDPDVEDYRTITREPGSRSSRGFIWIAIASLMSALVSSLINTPEGFMGYGLGCVVIFTLIIVPLFTVIFLAISAGIYRFLRGYLVEREHGISWCSVLPQFLLHRS